MPDLSGAGRRDRFACRPQIDIEVLLRLRRRRPRHADELKKGIAGRVERRRAWIGTSFACHATDSTTWNPG